MKWLLFYGCSDNPDSSWGLQADPSPTGEGSSVFIWGNIQLNLEIFLSIWCRSESWFCPYWLCFGWCIHGTLIFLKIKFRNSTRIWLFLTAGWSWCWWKAGNDNIATQTMASGLWNWSPFIPHWCLLSSTSATN